MKKKLKFITAVCCTLLLLNNSVYAAINGKDQIKVNDLNPTLKVDCQLKNDSFKSDDSKNLPKVDTTKINLNDAVKNQKKHSKLKNGLVSNSLKMQSISENVDSLEAQSEVETTTPQAVTENTTIGNSLYVDINTLVTGTINTEGEQRWYFTQVSNPGKLTAFMQTVADTNVDYDLHLFSFDQSNGQLNEIKFSSFGPGINEQVSDVVNSGYYFICVSSYKGCDSSNPFAFVLEYSAQYDAAEPDDTFNTIKTTTTSQISVQQTIDNPFDVDWIGFTLAETSIISTSLTNVSSSNLYKVDIINSQLNVLGTLDANSNYNFVLPAGTYYARIRSNSGFDAQQKYNFNLKAYLQSTLLSFSPDYKYVLTTDPNKNVYLNGKAVDLSWKREYNFSFPGGGYQYRSQEIYAHGANIQCLGGQYGTYTSTYTGTISHAFNLAVQNVAYLYWYTYYPNGGSSTHDQINEPLDFPVAVILNADTGKIVDLNSDLNFYYSNNIESHNFTATK